MPSLTNPVIACLSFQMRPSIVEMMKVLKRVYKYRFYPNKTQKKMLAQTFGCVRFVYNWGLQDRKTAYEKTGKGIGYNETSKRLKELKLEKEWLSDVSSVTLQQSLRHLDRAYSNFFKRLAKYPRFKNRAWKQSAHYMKNGFTFRDGILKIAKIGDIQPVWSRRFFGTPSSLTISKDCFFIIDGRYFVSILVEEKVPHLALVRKTIGLDMGVNDVAVGSDGFQSGNPKYTYKYETKLRMGQKSLSRKKKDSKNREKQKNLVARVHSKIRNSRKDFLHKLSTDIVRKNQVVYIEDLNTKGMVRNRKLSKAISDSSWGSLANFLEYKCDWYGRELKKVSPKFTSQDCSHCGYRNTDLKLSMRCWDCPSCGSSHDRDINAAKNVLAVGTTVSACGDSVRPKVLLPKAVVGEARISSL